MPPIDELANQWSQLLAANSGRVCAASGQSAAVSVSTYWQKSVRWKRRAFECQDVDGWRWPIMAASTDWPTPARRKKCTFQTPSCRLTPEAKVISADFRYLYFINFTYLAM